MNTYKAFLYTELIFIKRNFLAVVFGIIASLIMFFGPYYNQFNLSGIRYSQETASLIVVLGTIAVSTLFSSLVTINLTIFEKTNGIHFFLFNNNINKFVYILEKLTVPMALLFINLIIPLTLYINTDMYTKSAENLTLMLTLPIISVVVLTLISILSSLIFDNLKNISLCSFVSFIFIISIMFMLIFLLHMNIYIVIIIYSTLTVLLFIVTYLILNKKETHINFIERLTIKSQLHF